MASNDRRQGVAPYGRAVGRPRCVTPTTPRCAPSHTVLRRDPMTLRLLLFILNQNTLVTRCSIYSNVRSNKNIGASCLHRSVILITKGGNYRVPSL